MVRRVDPHGAALVSCRKMLGLCPVPSGAEADEPQQTKEEGHKRTRKDVLKKILKLEKESSWTRP